MHQSPPPSRIPGRRHARQQSWASVPCSGSSPRVFHALTRSLSRHLGVYAPADANGSILHWSGRSDHDIDYRAHAVIGRGRLHVQLHANASAREAQWRRTRWMNALITGLLATCLVVLFWSAPEQLLGGFARLASLGTAAGLLGLGTVRSWWAGRKAVEDARWYAHEGLQTKLDAVMHDVTGALSHAEAA